MFGILASQEIEEVLKTGLVGRIGCHANDETYIVPISYGYDGNYIYCHTHEGKKTEFMRRNPKICFEVDMFNDMANWKSVILQGTFEELTNKEERVLALQTLLSRYLPLSSSATTHLGELWPFYPEDVDEITGTVFRISIADKTGRFERAEASPVIPG
jgi:uncharacterized protein